LKNLGRPGLQAGKQSLSLQEHLALRSGSSKSNFFARAVTKHLLKGELEEQRQTQKKRQVGEQWQRSSKRQGAPLRNINIGLQPQPDKTAGRPNSLPIADDRDPMDPAKPLGRLGKQARAASAVILS
jgi:hypothetical protein